MAGLGHKVQYTNIGNYSLELRNKFKRWSFSRLHSEFEWFTIFKPAFGVVGDRLCDMFWLAGIAHGNPTLKS
jgi:hypothetical protein